MNSTLLTIIFALPTHKWLTDFFDPIYSVFIPAFIVSMIISWPLAMRGRRKALALLLGLGCGITVTLIFLGLTIPFGISFYQLAMPILAPIMMAISISLILTAEKTNLHFILRFILCIFIVSGPFIFEKTLIPYAKAKHDHKIAERAKNEPLLRNITITADLGGNIIYLPLRSTRIRIGDYEKKKAFAKLAKKGRTLKLSRLHFGNHSRKEECVAEKYKNPAFWCDYKTNVRKRFLFSTHMSFHSHREKHDKLANSIPDENGFIHVDTDSQNTSYLMLPKSSGVDAKGLPIYMLCKGEYPNKNRRLECNLNFWISENLGVRFVQVRAQEAEMASIVLNLKKDAEYILSELQKRP